MNSKNTSHSSLVLIELIIVILFFSIAAAICMKIFASSYILTNDSRNLNIAAASAENAAECYKACSGDIVKTSELLNASVDGGQIIQKLDNELMLFLDNGQISVMDGSDTIFEIEVKLHDVK